MPGIPLASEAPGAPEVDPPIAVGHVGVAGGGVDVGAELAAAGVVVYVRPADTLADVAEVAAAACVGVGAALAESVEVFVDVTSAAAVLPPNKSDAEAEPLLEANVLATISALARDGAMETDDPAP